MQHLRSSFEVSERHACELIGIAVSSYRYQSRRNDEPLREQLVALAREKPRFGYRRLRILLPDRGSNINPKRLYRVYKEAGLCVKRRKRKRLLRAGPPASMAKAANEEWALDFAADSLATGRRIRVLSVLDVFTRECLALEVDTSFASRRVTRVLERIIAERGLPQNIRCDNGPELTSRHFISWCVEHRIALLHIQPGRPMQNGHVESFTGKLRDECLNVNWFRNLFDAKRRLQSWRLEYNGQRPHSSLGYLTPEQFASKAASPSPPWITAPGAAVKAALTARIAPALTAAPLRGSSA